MFKRQFLPMFTHQFGNLLSHGAHVNINQTPPKDRCDKLLIRKSRGAFLPQLFTRAAVLGHVFYRFHCSSNNRIPAEKRLNSIYPIAGSAMQVCHSNHDERFAIDAVEQSVRETRQPAPANPWLDLRIRHWKSHGASGRTI